MSIFGRIATAIFGGEAEASEAAKPGTDPAATGAQPSSGWFGGKSNVDVAAVLDERAKSAGQKLDWRRSIVDLMKLLKLDSSLKARTALADELKYTGDKKDSATMNVWLHKQVMVKLAENGGVVPKELQS